MSLARHNPKRDLNEPEIVEHLRTIPGCEVHLLSGKGIPDLLVGYRGVTILLEVKNPEGRNREEATQRDFFASWTGGPAKVVKTPEEAVEALQEATKRRSGER